MKPVRFTDSHRFPFGPYADAKASSEPNYLRDKFARIEARQKADAAEAQAKTIHLRKKGASNA